MAGRYLAADVETGGTVPELPLADRHETVLPAADEDALARLALAPEGATEDRRRALAAIVADHPTFVEGWARLARLGRDAVERYAYARVGYHRGLDALRAAGWGGTGLVRWTQPTNRGFLRCLVELRSAADEIGESHEVERIDEFLRDLDPDWDDSLPADGRS